jgi:cyanophycinase
MKDKFNLTIAICFFIAFINPIFVIAQKKTLKSGETSRGNLFIIGGGEKSIPLMQDLIKTAGISKDDYVVVLPMSSEIPDSAIIWTREDFASAGFHNVTGFNFLENIPPDPDKIDSLKKARLIFISGGDQNKFMKIVQKGPIYEAIHYAYKNGSTIAGTSAGAAVMSRKMITGNSLKYPEYTGRYPAIEPDNIEMKEGLGLVDKLIVDQHFIKRQRMNRLIAVSLEHPEEVCVGIDESTAIVVTGNSFRVSGENQVIVIRNKSKSRVVKNNLLGGKGLSLDVLLPGDLFHFK